jgi:hypothetical protein
MLERRSGLSATSAVAYAARGAVRHRIVATAAVRVVRFRDHELGLTLGARPALIHSRRRDSDSVNVGPAIAGD